ncbi:MAG TPA: sulfite exporter TauE/SafE family protein [Symbiobacteriaceae bacterium]|nr:sulfite exporter TauE/SafE family protein [Symbiobacteriaceae bacterium]
MELVLDFASRWYTALSQWSAQVGQPLQSALSGQNIPAVSALLLGLLGGLAPCQVSGNAGAIAYVTQADREERPLFGTVRDYVLGKMAVYVLLGFLAAMLGLELPTPVMALLRKLTGPLMILMGLYFAGLLRWQGSAGARVTAWLQARMPRQVSPPFWLGVAFSLGFCPTMAIVFFGALVPLVVQAQAGLILPVIFALGTALPVILWALALAAGRTAAGRWVKGVRRMDRWVRVVAAVMFLLLGLNDTILYWLT